MPTSKRADGSPIVNVDLATSAPADGLDNVPRSTWIRLDFGTGLDASSADGVMLDCRATTPEFDVDVFEGKTLVINPKDLLPANTSCTVHWTGRSGVEQITFETPTFEVTSVAPDTDPAVRLRHVSVRERRGLRRAYLLRLRDGLQRLRLLGRASGVAAGTPTPFGRARASLP